MRVVMFKPQFAEAIRTGAKRQTIRPRFVPKLGERLSLREWTGLPYRSKQRELAQVMVTEMFSITIQDQSMMINGVDATPEEIKALTIADGFRNEKEMRQWFAEVHGVPFYGTGFGWKPA